MRKNLKTIKAGFSFVVFVMLLLLAFNYRMCIYLCHQAYGQFRILRNAVPCSAFEGSTALSRQEKENLHLLPELKKFSVGELGFIPTHNFEKIYNQSGDPVLWVLTASEPYSLEAYEWVFPLIGEVSYKGFFKKEMAEAEETRLKYLGYDTDVRPVTAWSTLGWFDDPLLSNMLAYSKSAFCNLIFHELFHATFYKKSRVDENENLANFVAVKATELFLKKDTQEMSGFRNKLKSEKAFHQFMKRQCDGLSKFYKSIQKEKHRKYLKEKYFSRIGDSLKLLSIINESQLKRISNLVRRSGNAYFIDFRQYEYLQDSLENVFNKNYRRDLKKMIAHLKAN